MHQVRHTVNSIYRHAQEALTPITTKSQFKERRVLTPDEFVEAGDGLVRSNPSWQWTGAVSGGEVDYLPKEKQMLVTRNVPCLHRAAHLMLGEETLQGGGGDEDADMDEWVAPASMVPAQNNDELAVLGEEEEEARGGEEGGVGGEEGEEESIPDIDDVPEEEDDEAAVAAPVVDSTPPGGECAGDEVEQQRTYDIYITYDRMYIVPRFWLIGYDQSGTPLTKEEVMQDVSEEHAKKTITIDKLPHLGVPALYIHPCKHEHTMKKLADRIEAGGGVFSVQQYMILFLKFIQSVVPTIEYDYTQAVSIGG